MTSQTKGDRRSIHPATVIRTYVSSLVHKRFPVLVLSWALAFAGQFLYVAGAPTVIYDFLGLGTDDFAWLFMPLVTGAGVASFAVPLLNGRWLNFVLGQALFLLLAVGLLYRLQRKGL